MRGKLSQGILVGTARSGVREVKMACIAQEIKLKAWSLDEDVLYTWVWSQHESHRATQRVTTQRSHNESLNHTES
jgi:hypothetical protein